MRKYFSHILILIAIIISSIVVFPGFADTLGIKKDYTIRQGLDLQGGTRLIYETDMSKVEASKQSEAATGVVEVIDRRINALGVAEPTIQKTRDNSRIIVELPGVKDVNEALKLIGETAQLEFREGVVGKSIDASGAVTTSSYEEWKDVGLNGSNFERADVQFSQGSTAAISTEPIINIRFKEEGRKIFAEVTGRNVGKPLAIFLDRQLLSAPKVEAKIDSDTAVISGNFNLQEAKNLVIQLNAGALPVPVKLVSQNNIGATLGTEAVQKSVIAGLIGLLLVILFMLIYYRLPGLIASLALILYTLFSLAIFMGMGVTLTLSGIAGFILSIGMAIDANILIFERMKEELRRGVPLKIAIESGFRRAWSSIKDSNMATLITALILYYLGAGLIRGFAVTLGLGVLVSMFTALTVSHVLLQMISNTNLRNKLALWGTRVQEVTK